MAEEKKRSGAKKRAAEEKDDFYDREEEMKPRSQKKRASASSSDGAKKRAETPHLKESAESRSELKKKESNPSSFGNQLMAILLSVIALFIIICFIFKDSVGLLGMVISDGFCGLFGFAAFFIPLFLIQLAIYWKKDVSTGAVRYKYIVAIFALLTVSILVHAIWSLAAGIPKFDSFSSAISWKGNLGGLWENGTQYRGGGFVGGFFAAGFIWLTGYPGTLIFGFLLLAVFLMTLFGLTPNECVQRCRFYYRLNRDKNRLQAAQRERKRAEQQAAQEEHMRAERQRQKESFAAKEAYEHEQHTAFAEDTAPKKEAHPRRRAASIDQDIFAEDAEFGKAEVKTSEEVLRAKTEAAEPAVKETPRETLKTIFKEDKKEPQKEVVLSRYVGFDDSFFEDDVKAAQKEISVHTKSIGESAGGHRMESEDENIFIMPKSAPTEKTVPAEVAAPAVAIPVVKTEKTAEKKEESAAPIVPDEISILPPEPMVEAPETDGADIPDEMPAPPKYEFPPIDILSEAEKNGQDANVSAELRENADRIIQTLESFHVHVSISHVSRGPTVTRYELEPAAGTRVRSITNLLDDIALSLATSGVRSDGIITGKSAIGIEVPNKVTNTVYVRELIEDKRFTDAKSRLTTCLGMDVSGAPVYLDVAKMPHLLIAGATGMGKSVCINSLLVSLLYKARPDEVKLILIDPKKVELNIYNGIPHLLVPVVFDPKKAAGSLHWAVTEMERRFELIEAQNTRNIAQYNAAIADDPKKEFLPQIVIIIDELADLMMSAPDDVEASICRLAQKARAAGMHLIIGTQRPSVDVITGLIKANIPSRIAFTVASQIDSRTIIDAQGAEKLIGRGDMLYAPVGASKPIRVQGSFVSEKEIEEIVDFIKAQSKGNAYSDEVIAEINRAADLCGQKKGKGGAAAASADGDMDESDPMLDSAIELAVESGKISTSLIQRRLSLGYGRAAKIIDMMERRGIVSAPEGQKPRTVLITREQYLEMKMNQSGDSSAQSDLDDEAPF